jgi:UDP-2,4-diacetamido-2,4,6-trideoxy-beta-L-altropyranose hydrolase
VSIEFRIANQKDCDLMFNWANDPETRKNAFNTSHIEYSEHILWFSQLNLNNVLIYFDKLNIPVGVVRFDNKSNEWVITIMVDSRQRNKGYASKMLSTSPIEFFKQNPLADKITTYIKESNTASIRAFSKVGFVLESTVLIGKFSCYKMTLSRNG